MQLNFIQNLINSIQKTRKKQANTKVTNYGKNNRIFLIKENGEKVEVKKIQGLDVEFLGDNSTIEICEPYSINSLEIKCSSNNKIKIGKNSAVYKKLSITPQMQEKCKVTIGENFICEDVKILMQDEPDMSVSIGDDCLFSFDVMISPSDGHTILNEKGEAINPAEDIKIGNRVWLGMGTKVLKGSIIPSNSVVGAGSIYTDTSIDSSTKRSLAQPFGEIFVGIPAKSIKSGITWTREKTGYSK
jgi:acetyltransferase-like isoleucine patch superfamily enzyme